MPKRVKSRFEACLLWHSLGVADTDHASTMLNLSCLFNHARASVQLDTLSPKSTCTRYCQCVRHQWRLHYAARSSFLVVARLPSIWLLISYDRSCLFDQASLGFLPLHLVPYHPSHARASAIGNCSEVCTGRLFA